MFKRIYSRLWACLVVWALLLSLLPYGIAVAAGNVIMVSDHNFEGGDYTVENSTNPITNFNTRIVKKNDETIWTYERNGTSDFSSFTPIVAAAGSNNENTTAHLTSNGVNFGGSGTILWHNLPTAFSTTDPSRINPKSKVTVEFRVKAGGDDLNGYLIEETIIGHGNPSSTKKLVDIYFKKSNPASSSGYVGVNYAKNEWNYIRMNIDFINKEVEMLCGPTLEQLRPWTDEKSTFGFNTATATGFGSILFTGKGYANIDDFKVYHNTNDSVDCQPAAFTNDQGVKIGNLKDQTVIRTSTRVTNRTDADLNPKMILAAYSADGLLTKTEIASSQNGPIAPKTSGTFTADIDISQLNDVKSVKAFLWESMEGLKPIMTPCGEVLNTPEKYIFGTLQNTQERLASNFDAGMRMAILELGWDSFYSSEGTKNTSYINGKKSLLQSMRNAGYKVMLDFGTQYPPSWIYNYPNSRWKNQYGEEFFGAVGETAVNVVFNDLMRQKQEQYISDAFTELGTDFEIVRLGLMRYGELGYIQPEYNGKTNCYWAFDDIAQGTTEGLPAGVVACPVPGWIPGEASTDHASARQFIEWYIDSLKNYHDWQITTVRKYFNNELAMLYPSWGLRDGQIDAAVNVDLNGTSGAEGTMEVQRAHDFKRFIEGITDPKVIVYGTWIDSNPDWSSPSNPCPIEFLANLAKAHPLDLKVMGENTGGGGMDAMTLTFQRVEENGLAGLMWAFQGDLYDTSAPVLADYKAYITEYQNK